MSEEKPPSTRSIIAEAEALRSEKQAGKNPRTRSLVRESEKLIGREDEPSGKRGLVGLVVVAALIAVALYFWLT